MNKVTINEAICKGCGLCVQVCPKKILRLSAQRLNSKGYTPSEIFDQPACIACAMCGMICPDSAILVEKEDK